MGLFNEYKVELSKSQEKGSRTFEILADLHGLSCGFKAHSTWIGEHFSEFQKQACGGHGYLVASGLTRPHLDMGVGFVTAEGDNTVLSQ